MIKIWTDGSCKNNGKKETRGGWSAILVNEDNNEYVIQYGYEENTTNNRMELLAAAEALDYVKEHFKNEEVILFTDSAYLCNCYKSQWHKAWLKNGWKTSNKKPVKNRDLWERIIPFFDCKEIKIEKVKGHADNKLNNLVDEVAQTCAEEGEDFNAEYYNSILQRLF